MYLLTAGLSVTNGREDAYAERDACLVIACEGDPTRLRIFRAEGGADAPPREDPALHCCMYIHINVCSRHS